MTFTQWRVVWNFTSQNNTLIWDGAAKHIVMPACMLHTGCVGDEAGARNLVYFPCKVAAAGDERYLLCAAGAAGVVVVHVCVVLCLYAFLESVLADRSVLAAWFLPCYVAMCVERRGWPTWCWKTHCNVCTNQYWEVLCASFVAQGTVVLWSFVVYGSTGTCFVQALQYTVVLGRATRKLCSTK